MKLKAKNIPTKLGIVAMALVAATVFQPWTLGQSKTEQITVDGSSTVYPITEKMAEMFNAEPDHKLDVTVNFSGTGGGFEKFCAGETDISNASRPISRQEMEACYNGGVAYIELPIAFDALTVVVNPANDWVDKITVEELKKIWQPEAEGNIKNWSDVRDSWPQEPLKLFGPGRDSGTFDYFTEAIMGTEGASRNDFVPSEDDDILVEGVVEDPNALGYFGFAYYEANQDKLKAVAIDSGNGPVLPSRETVENAEYQPLARPLFIYINAQAAQNKPALEDFVKFYLQKAPEIVKQVGYIPLPQEGYDLGKIHFERGKVGTVFDGKSEFNLTIGELLRKQAAYLPEQLSQ